MPGVPDPTGQSASLDLARRVFAVRVELLAEIDRLRPEPGGAFAQAPTPALAFGEPGSEPDRAEALAALRAAIAADLRSEIAGFSVDEGAASARAVLERYASPAAWWRIGPAAERELTEDVAGFSSSPPAEDHAAGRFDLLVLTTQLALLRGDSSLRTLQRRITETARLLEDLRELPSVAGELPLIREVQTSDFWLSATAPRLEAVRRALRPLVRLIEDRVRPRALAEPDDLAADVTDVEVPGVTIGGISKRSAGSSACSCCLT